MPKRTTVESTLADLQERLDALEARMPPSSGNSELVRLERAVADRIDAFGPGAKPPCVGQVELVAHVRLPTNTSGMTNEFSLESLLSASPESLAQGIAGLAHPVRIKLCRALLDGPKESTALLELAELNTTGQLYHHLQAMAEVGLVERRGRNLWAVQHLGAIVALLLAGKLLADWRGDDGSPADPEPTDEPAGAHEGEAP